MDVNASFHRSMGVLKTEITDYNSYLQTSLAHTLSHSMILSMVTHFADTLPMSCSANMGLPARQRRYSVSDIVITHHHTKQGINIDGFI